MLPLGDVLPPRTAPLVTITIIAVSTLAFAGQAFLDPQGLASLAQRFGLTPAAFSLPNVLTSLLIQDSGWHFAVSMLYLWIFGATLEDRLGRWKLLLLYLVTGATAMTTHALLDPTSPVPVVGASGASVGVLGAYFVSYPQSKVLTLVPAPPLVVEVPAVFLLALWWTIELISRIGRIGGPSSTDASTLPVLWALVAAGVVGALAGRVLRRPIIWDDRL